MYRTSKITEILKLLLYFYSVFHHTSYKTKQTIQKQTKTIKKLAIAVSMDLVEEKYYVKSKRGLFLKICPFEENVIYCSFCFFFVHNQQIILWFIYILFQRKKYAHKNTVTGKYFSGKQSPEVWKEERAVLSIHIY